MYVDFQGGYVTTTSVQGRVCIAPGLIFDGLGCCLSGIYDESDRLLSGFESKCNQCKACVCALQLDWPCRRKAAEQNVDVNTVATRTCTHV